VRSFSSSQKTNRIVGETLLLLAIFTIAQKKERPQANIIAEKKDDSFFRIERMF